MPVDALDATGQAPRSITAKAADSVATEVAASAPEAPATAWTPAPTAAPVAAPQADAVSIQPYELPTDSLASLAEQAGLQWVQSDAARIGAVQAAMAAEPAPARVPRQPRRQALVDDGPLVLVETRKDLSQLKLPFEAGAAR